MDDKKRLVIIQPALGRYRRGFVESLVAQNQEYEISIFCSPVDNAGVSSMETINNEVLYRKVDMISFFGMFFWQKLVSEVWKMGLVSGDALVINGNPRFLSSLIVSILYKLKGVSVFWWGHAWSSTSSKPGSYIRFKIMNLFNVILYTEEEIELSKNLISSPVTALNNGLDIGLIRKGFTFEVEKYSSSNFTVAFLGRHTSKSNFGLLVEALLLLPKELSKSISLMVIGDIEPIEIHRNYSGSESLDLNFLGEIWDEMEITFVMSKAHAFVYPGSVGLSLIHAFALGLPAIVHTFNTADMARRFLDFIGEQK
ncbi:MAG: glycosyltransferase [Reinekea sp.]